jgi:preprotein translocase subunit SecE
VAKDQPAGSEEPEATAGTPGVDPRPVTGDAPGSPDEVESFDGYIPAPGAAVTPGDQDSATKPRADAWVDDVFDHGGDQDSAAAEAASADTPAASDAAEDPADTHDSPADAEPTDDSSAQPEAAASDAVEDTTTEEFDNADPRGEDLAAELPDPGPYDLASDEDEAEELSDEADSDDGVDIEDPEQLSEATEEVTHQGSTRPVRRPAGGSAPPATPKAAAVRKNRPTRTRTQATATQEVKRTTPALFASQSVQELKKVVWPTGAQLRQYFIVVLVFVLFMIAFVALLDLGAGWLVLKIFGG